MKAPAFNYARALSLQEALELLSRHGGQAKVLAGGQSLIPALNLRLSAPEWIVDIGAISELRGIVLDGDVLKIGALTRHLDIQRSAEIAAHAPLLAEAILHVAHPAIRSRGTIGGSLAYADPAAELPACAVALDATIIARGIANGERRIRAADFFLGLYETRLAPDDLLVAIEVPVNRPTQRHFFREYARRSGDYAIAGLAAFASVDGDALTDLRLGYFAAGDRPVLAAASRHLVGTSVTSAMLYDAQCALDADLDPREDQQATVPMRRYLARELLSSCVASLLRRPDLESSKLA